MHFRTTIAAIFAFMASTSLATAQTYKYKTIDDGMRSSTLHGINVHNVIAGDFVDGNGILNCFLVKGNKKTSLIDSKGSTTFCSNLNKAGTVVGGYMVGSNYFGFSYSGTTFTDVPGPAGSTYSVAYGISDKGVIIGTYVDPSNTQHGFFLKGKTYTSFDPPNSTATLGVGINNSAAYTAQGFDAQGAPHSYFVSGSTTTELIFPGSSVTRVHALNNKGQVVMAWVDNGGAIHGGVYDSTTKAYTRIDYPNASSTGVLGIDDNQTLVGYYISADGSQHGFEASHLP